MTVLWLHHFYIFTSRFIMFYFYYTISFSIKCTQKLCLRSYYDDRHVTRTYYWIMFYFKFVYLIRSTMFCKYILYTTTYVLGRLFYFVTSIYNPKYSCLNFSGITVLNIQQFLKVSQSLKIVLFTIYLLSQLFHGQNLEIIITKCVFLSL